PAPQHLDDPHERGTEVKDENPEARLESWVEDAAAEHRRDPAFDPRIRGGRVERLEHVRLIEAMDEACEPPDRAPVDPLELPEVGRVDASLAAKRAVDRRGRELGRLHREKNAGRENGIEKASSVP